MFRGPEFRTPDVAYYFQYVTPHDYTFEAHGAVPAFARQLIVARAEPGGMIWHACVRVWKEHRVPRREVAAQLASFVGVDNGEIEIILGFRTIFSRSEMGYVFSRVLESPHGGIFVHGFLLPVEPWAVENREGYYA